MLFPVYFKILISGTTSRYSISIKVTFLRLYYVYDTAVYIYVHTKFSKDSLQTGTVLVNLDPGG
eukprot:SAG31_NODE_1889_length_6986_cov_3.253666_1_plen_64_part_00